MSSVDARRRLRPEVVGVDVEGAEEGEGTRPVVAVRECGGVVERAGQVLRPVAGQAVPRRQGAVDRGAVLPRRLGVEPTRDERLVDPARGRGGILLRLGGRDRRRRERSSENGEDGDSTEHDLAERTAPAGPRPGNRTEFLQAGRARTPCGRTATRPFHGCPWPLTPTIAAVRVWVDFTNTAHVQVLRPLVELLEEQGHEIELTARPLSQTVAMLDRWGRHAEVIGHHGGAGRLGKAEAAASRVPALRAGRAVAASTAGSRTARPTCRRSAGCSASRTRRCSTTSGRRSSTTSTAGWRRACSSPTRSPPPGCAVRRPAAEARPLPGAEGGVLPRRFRAGHRRARAGRRRPVAGHLRDPHRPVVRALPRRLREPAPPPSPAAHLGRRRRAGGRRQPQPRPGGGDRCARAAPRARPRARPSTAAAWSRSPICSSPPAGR